MIDRAEPIEPRLKEIQPLPADFRSSTASSSGHETLLVKVRTKNIRPRKKQWAPKVRTGCRNCKIDRRKCDERKPSCTRCDHKGIHCTFEAPAAWIFEPKQIPERHSIQSSNSLGPDSSELSSQPKFSSSEDDRSTLASLDISGNSLEDAACQSEHVKQCSNTCSASLASAAPIYASDQEFQAGLLVKATSSAPRTTRDLIKASGTMQTDRVSKSVLLYALPALPYDLDEQKSLRFYLEFTSNIASRFESSTFFWATIFLDRAGQSSGVKNSLLFFARHFESILQGRGKDQGHELFYFSLASRALTIESQAVENVLLAGTMFWMVDMFHGEWTRAMLHIDSLLKIVQETRQKALHTGIPMAKKTATIITYVEPLASHCYRFLGLQRSRKSLVIHYDVPDARLTRYVENCGDCEIRLLDIERLLLIAVDGCKDQADNLDTCYRKLREALLLVADIMESLVSQFPAPFEHTQQDDVVSSEIAKRIFHIVFTSKETVSHFCDVVKALTSDVEKMSLNSQDKILTRLRCTKVEHLLPTYIQAISSPVQEERDNAYELLIALRLA